MPMDLPKFDTPTDCHCIDVNNLGPLLMCAHTQNLYTYWQADLYTLEKCFQGLCKDLIKGKAAQAVRADAGLIPGHGDAAGLLRARQRRILGPEPCACGG